MPKVTKYTRTNGEEVDIASLEYPHSRFARDKLARMGDPARAEELEALSAHVAAQEEAYQREHPEGEA